MDTVISTASNREVIWAELMSAAARGDAAAYDRLLRDVAVVLRSVVRRRLARHGLSPDQVEDVVQETLIALHTRRDTWDSGRPIMPWIYGIARYKLVDEARRRFRNRRLVVDLPVEDWSETVAAPAAERDLRGFDPQKSLRKLSDRERSVVEGLVFDGLSVRALASVLAISESAVRVAFHRALARLSRDLADHNDDKGLTA